MTGTVTKHVEDANGYAKVCLKILWETQITFTVSFLKTSRNCIRLQS